MDRCHLYLPLVDSSGITYPYAEVTLLDLETGNPIDEPVYLDPYGGAPQQWPILIDPAVINFWTDNPLRVTVQAGLPGGATFTRSGVDILPAPAATVVSEEPVHIGSADGLSGEAMLAVSPDGSAAWQVLDVLRFHEHPGDAPESTVLGSPDLTDVYPGQTWIGRTPTGAQGEDAAVLGADAHPGGDDATILGRATAGPNAVAAGATASATDSSVALGAATNTGQPEQVVIGRASTAAAAPDGAIVVGSGQTALATDLGRIGAGIQMTADGKVIIGQGTLPDLSWVDWATAVLGSAVAPRYFGVRADAVLGAVNSVFGTYGAAGAAQPLVSSSGVTTATPGRTALLSLLSALDKLGLVYLTDGAIDDELADWTKAYAHDANLVLETGDSDGSKAGDTTRAKRNAAGSGSVTYQQKTGILDFRVRVFAYQPGGADVTTLATELVADVSPDNATWTRIPLAWRSLAATTASWYQTWAANARTLPAGSRYLRLTASVNASVFTPQIGRVVVRPGTALLTGFGSGAFGSGPFGG
ncbi:hypothetical protein AB0E08_07975 [Streptomyces sp. NPDC048281]|uniref:hypothetical protein n=1 Tax=Streptomyces sp. NPDC048281 TaxID=3154715 RepID=UPI003416C0DE